jgi:hypothetical protein
VARNTVLPSSARSTAAAALPLPAPFVSAPIDAPSPAVGDGEAQREGTAIISLVYIVVAVNELESINSVIIG